MTAKVTLIGMYNYSPSLFDGLVLPEGIDKDLFVNSLLIEKGEFETLYSDPNFLKFSITNWGKKWYPTFAKWLEGSKTEWNPIENYDRYEDSTDSSSKSYASITSADYSDKRTADLNDERTVNLTAAETVNLSDTSSTMETDRRSVNLTDQTKSTEDKDRTVNLKDVDKRNSMDTTVYNNDTVRDRYDSNEIQETTKAAFDAATYRPDTMVEVDPADVSHIHTGSNSVNYTGQNEQDHTGSDDVRTVLDDKTTHTGSDETHTEGNVRDSHTGTDTTRTTGTDTNTTTGTDMHKTTGTLADVSGTESDGSSHVSHVHGNIGVTQASDMLRGFYDIAAWNLYEHMSDVFASDLLICVY